MTFKAMSREALEGLASEVFALRRRVVELEAENRQLKMRLPRQQPPIPAPPESGFAIGIADATGIREVVIPGNHAKFGTDESCNVKLPGARWLHALIERTGDGVLIHDLGTAEGTWVNGQRVTNGMLSSGDRVTICDAELVVVFGPG